MFKILVLANAQLREKYVTNKDALSVEEVVCISDPPPPFQCIFLTPLTCHGRVILLAGDSG